MISVTLPPIDGSVIGKHPFIHRFMQSIYYSKPKHSIAWNEVITHINTLPSNEHLSLKELSGKLVILVALALCNADRASKITNCPLPQVQAIFFRENDLYHPMFDQNQTLETSNLV